MAHQSNKDFFYPPKQLTDLSPFMRPGTACMPPQVLVSGTTPSGNKKCNGSLFDSKQMKTRKKVCCVARILGSKKTSLRD